MDLFNLPKVKSRRPRKRAGRGIGSGKGGHTTGRGAKGQKIRSSVSPSFEGGQSPFYKRIPKVRGFKSQISVLEVSTDSLSRFDDGATLSKTSLIKAFGKKASKYRKVKVIRGSGKLTKKLNFNGVGFSESAAKLVLASGGSVSK